MLKVNIERKRIMNSITEKTLIPVSLVITFISVALWVSAIWYDTKANAKDIESLKIEKKVLAEQLVQIQKIMIEKLTRIETKLGINGQ